MEIKRVEIDGETIYLKKNSKLGYKVIYPWKKENYKPYKECSNFKEWKKGINWFNLWTGGSWWNLLIVFIIVFVVLGLLYEYSANIERFMNCFTSSSALENCKIAYSPDYMKINLSNFTR